MGKEGEMRRKREIVKKEKSGEYARKNWRKEGQWGSKRGEERVGNSKEGQEGKRKKAEGERERDPSREEILHSCTVFLFGLRTAQPSKRYSCRTLIG